MNWKDQFDALQQAAAVTMKVAFPLLETVTPPTGCCETRLAWQDETAEASGSVCIDDFMQATLQFESVPQAVAGPALDEVFGKSWFDGADDGIAAADEGSYYWTDETNAAEWSIKVGADGTVDLDIEYTNVPDIVTLLDALQVAYESSNAEAAT
ncbi:hypothetical protein [Streptomyces sp. NPDC085665]|uniref:hypothetical protein n=1 Tax=Streptomyces sp. NPDC085665 TaxID=3365735 RepID=UPI0037D8FCB1